MCDIPRDIPSTLRHLIPPSLRLPLTTDERFERPPLADCESSWLWGDHQQLRTGGLLLWLTATARGHFRTAIVVIFQGRYRDGDRQPRLLQDAQGLVRDRCLAR